MTKTRDEITNDEINRYIAVEIMGQKCWHDWENLASILMYKCRKCGEGWSTGFNPNPQYTSDSSPRSLLNEVVAMLVRQRVPVPHFDWFATAEQIARAAVSAWAAREDGK